MSLAYLFDSNIQFQDKSGNNNVNGFLRVYIDNTDDRAVTYKDFNGTLNQADIRLDNNGRAVVIVDDSKTYRLEVYGTTGVLLWTLYPISPKATGINDTLEALVAAVKSHTIAIEGLALGKKNKQQAKVISGTTTQTVKSLSQNADGEITVEFEDIAFPHKVLVDGEDSEPKYLEDAVKADENGLLRVRVDENEDSTPEHPDKVLVIDDSKLRDEIDSNAQRIDSIVDTIDGLDVDSVPHAYLHSTLAQSAGDSVTTRTTIDTFAVDALESECFEFEETTTIDDVPFGYVWIEPGTYLINAAVTLQWVGNPRGTFIAKVGSVMGENFDFSQEQELSRQSTKVVTIPSRMKLAMNVTYDAGTPVMGFWIKSMQVVKLAGGMSQTNIIHDSTLTGKGSVAEPLGVTTDAFGKVKDIPTSISQFRNGDVIPVDGPSGTCKMSKDTLLTLTSQNALAGNVAQEYNGTTGAVAGYLYVHGGVLYLCKEDTSGDWVSSKFESKSVEDVINSKFVSKVSEIELDDIAFTDGYGVIAVSGLDDRPIGTLDGSPTQSATDFIAIPNVFDGVLVFLECVRTTATAFGLCFYDSRKSVISGIPHPTDSEEGTRNRTVEIPVNAAFVRFSCTTTEKANFFAKVTSKIKIDVDGLDEKIDNQYKLIDIGSDVSFTDGKFVIATSDAGTLGSLRHSEYQSASDYIKIPTITNGILQYMNGVYASSDLACGLVFYDADYTAISGVLEFRGSSVGAKENVVEIPNGAVYFRCTIPTAYKTEFFANVMTILYHDVKESQKGVESLSLISLMVGGEVSSYAESLTIGDWTSNKFYRAHVEIGTIGNSTYQSIIRVDLPDGVKRKLNYTRAKDTAAASSLNAGLVFFDKDGSAISGILNVPDSAELGYEEYTTDVPYGAASVGFTMPTALLSNFAASVNGYTIVYNSGLGKEVENLQSIVEANATGAEPSPQDCWNRFGVAVDEKCKYLGITGQRIYGPSGYGVVSWNTENDEHGRAYVPVYAVCKWMAASIQYETLSSVFNCDSFEIKTLGVEATIDFESSLKSSDYSDDLLGHYDILSWKTGTVGGSFNLLAVTACVPSCDGAVFSAVIRRDGTDGEGSNRYLAMKLLLDIACAKYENRSADVSSLETDLLATGVTHAMAILTPKGCGSAFLGRVDVTDSGYMLYNYGGATSEISPMSTVKVLVAETVLDYITNLNEYVTVISEDKAAAEGGTHPLFAAGEKVTYRQLLYAMLILSSNEAGYILARCVGKKLLETYRGNGFLPVE